MSANLIHLRKATHRTPQLGQLTPHTLLRKPDIRAGVKPRPLPPSLRILCKTCHGKECIGSCRF
jgi:hypothetical protein